MPSVIYLFPIEHSHLFRLLIPEQNKIPAIFVVNQCDHEKADFDLTLEQAKNRFGARVLPVQFPVQVGAGFTAIIVAILFTASIMLLCFGVVGQYLYRIMQFQNRKPPRSWPEAR